MVCQIPRTPKGLAARIEKMSHPYLGEGIADCTQRFQQASIAVAEARLEEWDLRAGFADAILWYVTGVRCLVGMPHWDTQIQQIIENCWVETPLNQATVNVIAAALAARTGDERARMIVLLHENLFQVHLREVWLKVQRWADELLQEAQRLWEDRPDLRRH
ncbi:MAG: hypothetical protein GXC94_01715 [Comamonadaceae bacterium]|nr:hypothetical protein [Comamonadaceae bacterium]